MIVTLDIETYSVNGVPPWKQLERGYLHDPIVSVSFVIAEDQNLKVLTIIKDIKDERVLLQEVIKTLEEIGGGILLTYNGKRFDIPALIMRSEFYGIKDHLEDALKRYEHRDVWELAKEKQKKGSLNAGSLSLKNVANMLNISNDIKGNIEGKDYFKYYERWRSEGDHTAILYNQNDVLLTLNVYRGLHQLP